MSIPAAFRLSAFLFRCPFLFLNERRRYASVGQSALNRRRNGTVTRALMPREVINVNFSRRRSRRTNLLCKLDNLFLGLVRERYTIFECRNPNQFLPDRLDVQ